MTKHRPLLLLTRPEGSAQRFVAQLDSAVLEQVDVMISPLLAIVPVGCPLDLDNVAGLIFTSANGVTATASATDRRDQAAYCVGPATTAAARKAGWNAIQSGRNADELVAALIAQRPAGPLLHLRGEHARGSVSQRLSQAGITTGHQVVYSQQAQSLTDAAAAALASGRPVICPLFSPRSAKLFSKQAPPRPVVIVALSDAVAQAVRPLKNATLHVARSPDAQTMAKLVEKLLRASVSG